METADRIGTEFLINTATAGEQVEPKIVTLAGGGFVVMWIDLSLGVGGAGGDTSGAAVKAQVFAADGSPLGGEIRVNTSTLGDQRIAQIAALPGGGFVVTWTDGPANYWQDKIGGDGSASGIKAQVFAADGARIGDELAVNTTTLDRQLNPQITVLANGGFAIVWDDLSETSALYDYESDIRARIYSPEGVAVGGDILVNTRTFSNQYVPMIAPTADGGFVAVWNDFQPYIDPNNTDPDPHASGVKAQLIGPDGARVGPEILVNTTTRGDQFMAEVEGLKGGGFVVTWCDMPVNGTPIGDGLPGRGFRAQVFSPAGQKVGGEIILEDDGAGYYPRATIAALADGGFVVTWNDWVLGLTGQDARAAVKAQIFSADGQARSEVIIVDPSHGWGSGDPEVEALPDGGFVLTWTDTPSGAIGGDQSAHSVKIRVYTSTGVPAGDEILVNVATRGDQWGQDIAVRPDGTVAVVWMDFSHSNGGAIGDYSGHAIKGQLFSTRPPSGFFDLDNAPVHVEGGSAVVLDADARIVHPALDAADSYAGATLTLARRGGANAEDVFGASGALAFSEGAILLNGVRLGTVAQSGGTLTLNFSAAATADAVDAVLRQLTYASTSEAPPASVTVEYRFDAGVGPPVAPANLTVRITPVNDAPVAQPAAVTTDEDAPISGRIIASDVDSATLGFTLVSGPANGVLVLNPDGAWTYTPHDNFAGEDSFTVSANDGQLSSEPVKVTVTVLPDETADVGGDLALLLAPEFVMTNAAERSAVRFTALGIDPDIAPADARVTFTDATGASITVLASTGAADLSTLADGPVTAVLHVADDSDNTARTGGVLLQLDTVADAGPRAAVSLAADVLGSASRSAAAFTLSGVDADAMASVTFTSSGGGSVTLTGLVDGQGTVDLSALAAGELTATLNLTDGAGNAAVGLGDKAVIDLTPPALSVTVEETDNDGLFVAGETLRFTFRFSEAVTGFTEADIVLPEDAVLDAGSLRQSATDPTVYTATGVLSSSGMVTVAAGAYADLGGNSGAGGAAAVTVTGATETGTPGRDNLIGSQGDDILVGGAGPDRLNGLGGDDTLYGGEDADVLFGGLGTDVLVGGAGDDQLGGGRDGDRFVFSAAGFGHDTVADFSAAEGDRIDLRGLGLTFADLQIIDTFSGASIVIGDDSIVLNRVDASALSAADFIF